MCSGAGGAGGAGGTLSSPTGIGGTAGNAGTAGKVPVADPAKDQSVPPAILDFQRFLQQ